MIAPQPTHDQAHEANIQERERGRELLLRQLRDSNSKLAADAHAKAEEIAELKRELSDLRESYEMRGFALTEIAEKVGLEKVYLLDDVVHTVSAIVKGAGLNEQKLATASRELVELRERAEGAEAKLSYVANRMQELVEKFDRSPSYIGHHSELKNLASALLATLPSTTTTEQPESVDGLLHDRAGPASGRLLKASPVLPAEQPGRAGEEQVEIGQSVIVDWGDGPFEATVTREDFGADGNSERTVCVEWVVEEPVKVRKRSWCKAANCKPLSASNKEPTP